MWTSQFYKFNKPRHWLSSSGLGTMGFGLPAAMGMQAANPDALCIDIDGDGSFQMNIQELATLYCEKLPVKVLLLNNQHLGMVTQWEDRFMGRPTSPHLSGAGRSPGSSGRRRRCAAERDIPEFCHRFQKAMASKPGRCSSKKDLPAALEEMLTHDGPYLLDVICAYQEHVLPMIPSGGTAQNMILE